jgi:sec-independent protein translocase protein TatA
MGTFSIWHWLIVLAVVLILFGGSGKISSLMGDVAKGIRSFKKGLQEDDESETASKEETKALEDKTAAAAKSGKKEEEKAGS